jgi:hypothetical protein
LFASKQARERSRNPPEKPFGRRLRRPARAAAAAAMAVGAPWAAEVEVDVGRSLGGETWYIVAIFDFKEKALGRAYRTFADFETLHKTLGPNGPAKRFPQNKPCVQPGVSSGAD